MKAQVSAVEAPGKKPYLAVQFANRGDYIKVMEDRVIEILSCKSRRAALRYLITSTDDVTGRELARLTGFSHQQAHNALNQLVELGVVGYRRVGPSHLFRLNWTNNLVTYIVCRLLVEET